MEGQRGDPACQGGDYAVRLYDRLGAFARFTAIALFVTTVVTIGVMWQSAFWATAVPELAAFALAAAWLIASLAGAAKLRHPFVLILLVLAAVWPVMQLAAGVTVYRWATSIMVLYWATGAALFFVGLQIFSDAAVRKPYLRALVILGFAISVIAPLQLFTGDGKIFWIFEVPYTKIVMGPFVYPNQYAAFIELLLPVALTGIFSDRAGWRTVHGLAAVVMYASIFASHSRAGGILTTLEVLVVPVLAATRAGISKRQQVLSGLALLAMLALMSFAVGPDMLIERLAGNESYGGRREFTRSSLRMIPEKPLLGVGMGNWPAVYPAHATFDDGLFANQAHNDWAQWAVEGGLPFAFLMLAVAVWSVPRAFRTCWGIGVVVVFLHCFVDYPIQRMGVAVVFFTMLAAIAFADDRDRAPGGAVL